MRQVVNKPQLNQVAISKPLPITEINTKRYDSYSFMEGSILRQATELTPVYRYAKNYELKKKQFSILLITQDKDSKRVEKFLDKVAKDVKNIEDFAYLGVEYKG